MATHRQLRLPAAVMLLAAAATTTACPPQPPPTMAAGFDTTHVDTVSINAIQAYGMTLDFDTVLGAADRQPLFTKGGIRYGFAKIDPERGAYRLDTGDLARGRIIARIASESAYARLGLGPGVNWWWVDKKGGKWRSIMYSNALGRSVQILDSLGTHPGYTWHQSTARIMLGDSTAYLWGSCGKCCPKF